MSVKVINPESLMLKQSEGMWMKYCALLLWKLHGRDNPVTITIQDIEAMTAEFGTEQATVMVKGTYNTFSFALISETEAHKMAVADAKTGGHV